MYHTLQKLPIHYRKITVSLPHLPLIFTDTIKVQWKLCATLAYTTLFLTTVSGSAFALMDEEIVDYVKICLKKLQTWRKNSYHSYLTAKANCQVACFWCNTNGIVISIPTSKHAQLCTAATAAWVDQQILINDFVPITEQGNIVCFNLMQLAQRLTQ